MPPQTNTYTPFLQEEKCQWVLYPTICNTTTMVYRTNEGKGRTKCRTKRHYHHDGSYKTENASRRSSGHKGLNPTHPKPTQPNRTRMYYSSLREDGREGSGLGELFCWCCWYCGWCNSPHSSCRSMAFTASKS